jgi:hypothetical protein
MQHLSTDRLAALGDELPTTDESAHLAICDDCRLEQAAYRSLVAMAQAEQASIALPLTRWDNIAAALRDTSPSFMTRPSPLRRASGWPMQAAAGLLLVAGGAMLGRTSAGASALPGQAATSADVASTDSATASVLPVAAVSFRTVADARAAQQRYELLYQQAAAFLSQHDSSTMGIGSPVAYRSRLAALDQVISPTREAMRAAPHDPVINGYYLTTLGQREATLRQLNTALPASLRLNSF